MNKALFNKNNPTCHDCRKKITIKDNIAKNGKLLKYKSGEDNYWAFKCNNCHETNKALTNFRKTEVYSRVVGYLRPLEQWNKGKRQEFKERIEYVKGIKD